MVIFGLAQCYYHIFFKYQHAWGYENWVYLAVLLWAAEKGVRAIKMTKNSFKTARTPRIDDEYIRLDIPDVKATGYVYLYFPTLNWRFWENHPFSIASSVYERTESGMDEKVLPSSPIFELVGSDLDSDAESDIGELHKLKVY